MDKFAPGIVSQYPKQAPFSVGPDPHVHLKIRGEKNNRSHELVSQALVFVQWAHWWEQTVQTALSWLRCWNRISWSDSTRRTRLHPHTPPPLCAVCLFFLRWGVSPWMCPEEGKDIVSEERAGNKERKTFWCDISSRGIKTYTHKNFIINTCHFFPPCLYLQLTFVKTWRGVSLQTRGSGEAFLRRTRRPGEPDRDPAVRKHALREAWQPTFKITLMKDNVRGCFLFPCVCVCVCSGRLTGSSMTPTTAWGRPWRESKG